MKKLSKTAKLLKIRKEISTFKTKHNLCLKQSVEYNNNIYKVIGFTYLANKVYVIIKGIDTYGNSITVLVNNIDYIKKYKARSYTNTTVNITNMFFTVNRT